MNLLVFTLRGLRASALGCYGNDWIATPTLDRLASESVVFDEHFADLLDPERDGPSWARTLVDAVRARGMAARLIVDRSRPVADDWLRGWDAVVEVEPDEADQPAPVEVALAAARQALRELADAPDWLLWIDLASLLPPWRVSAEFLAAYFPEESETDEDDPLTPLLDPPLGSIDPTDDVLHYQVQTTYAAAVTELDSALEPFLRWLRRQGREADTLLVVTSDAGQSLAEHGQVGRADGLPYEERVHLPCILRLPGGAEAGRRVAALTQASDLPATLAEFLGAACVPGQGRSLRPLLHGQAGSLRDLVRIESEGNGPRHQALRTADWACIFPGKIDSNAPTPEPMLFVKPDDRWEVNDVSHHHPEIVEEMRTRLERDGRESDG